MKLIEILSQHSSWDSSTTGTDKNTTHDYINGFYEGEFNKYKNKKITLLEIGTNRGASLSLWKEYFTKGKIYGIDTTKQYLIKEHTDVPGIEYIWGDAYSEEIIKSLPKFDIVIDDGPHTLESQVECINLYLPKLKKGGVLIIEDVQDLEHFKILLENVPDALKENVETVDLRENIGRYDDLIFVVRK